MEQKRPENETKKTQLDRTVFFRLIVIKRAKRYTKYNEKLNINRAFEH